MRTTSQNNLLNTFNLIRNVRNIYISQLLAAGYTVFEGSGCSGNGMPKIHKRFIYTSKHTNPFPRAAKRASEKVSPGHLQASQSV